MAQSNRRTPSAPVHTHGGAPAARHLTPIQQLRRSVLSCLLWEGEYYEDGKSIASRIEEASRAVKPEQLAELAIEARSVHNLRHVPMLLLCVLAKTAKGKLVGDAIAKTIQRADELAEFLSLYWRGGKTPLSKQVKRGLALAFQSFSEYDLTKYNRDNDIKLRDVAFLVHAKPQSQEQAQMWARLLNKKYFPKKYDDKPLHPVGEFAPLSAPDTWEVALSGGADKKETFERLLREGNLGYLALLRNLRNMAQAGVDEDLIKTALLLRKGARRVLPFRYVAAARAAPRFEPTIDKALQEAIADLPVLDGPTSILVDVSGSMDAKLSGKSDMTRMDAACTLASIVNCPQLRVFTFSTKLVEVPPRRGMAGVDVMRNSQQHGGTHLAEAVEEINRRVPCKRLIVVTDEQATTAGIPVPKAELAYMINVASYKNGVGYGKWNHIDGFSENVIRWMVEFENPKQ